MFKVNFTANSYEYCYILFSYILNKNLPASSANL